MHKFSIILYGLVGLFFLISCPNYGNACWTGKGSNKVYHHGTPDLEKAEQNINRAIENQKKYLGVELTEADLAGFGKGGEREHIFEKGQGGQYTRERLNAFDKVEDRLNALVGKASKTTRK